MANAMSGKHKALWGSREGQVYFPDIGAWSDIYGISATM